MLKKILAGLLALSMLFLTACKSSSDETKEWLMSELELESEPTTDEDEEESMGEAMLFGNTESEDPLRICVDLLDFSISDPTSIYRVWKDLLARLKNTVDLEDVVIEVIPSPYVFQGTIEEEEAQAKKRTAVEKRIQSEIMDGGGPDVFIMSYIVYSGKLGAKIDETGCVFNYPQKAMEYGYFLPLDELIENNTVLTEWDKLTQPVLEAGRNWEGQQIIPLSYTLPLLCYPKAVWEHVPDKEYTWNDMLTNPAFLPYLLDLANCGSSLTYIDVDSTRKTEFWPSSDYLKYIMGEFADFENEELGFTEEELLKCISDIQALEKIDYYEEVADAQELYVGPMLSEIDQNKAMTYLPIYNIDGGVTAHIEKYAAINRNTEKAEEAFKVIDLLMSKEVQRFGNIYHEFVYSFDTVPMHEDLFQESEPIGGYSYYLKEENYEAFCKVRRQITCANFESEGTNMLSDLMGQCISEGYLEFEEKTLEQAVHETYEEMQRRLRE